MTKNFIVKMIVCGFAWATVFSSTAQNLEVSWGNEVQPDKSTIIGQVLDSDKDGYFIVKNVGCGLFGSCKRLLSRSSLNHELEYEVELPQKVNGKDAKGEGTFRVEGKTIRFLSQRDKKNDVNKLFALTISDNGKISNEILVDEIYYKGRKDEGGFDITYLKESKRFLITHDEGYSKKGFEQANYKAYTQDFKLLWEKAIELPYKDKKFIISGYQFDEDGNVFMHGRLGLEKKMGFEKNTMQIVLFAYYHKTDKLEEVKIGFDEAYAVSDLNFNYYKGELHFTGFYFDKKGGIQGVCSTKINAKTLKVEQEKTIPFSKEDVLKFGGERDAKKQKGVRANYDINDIYRKENGDYYIIAEAYHEITTTTTTTNSNGVTTTRTSTSYNYGNIMVINLTKEGTINWTQTVPKYQSSVNDGGYYSSYTFAFDKNNFYFMFNDNMKNLSPKVDPKKKGKYLAKTQRPKKLVVHLATLNQQTGKFTSDLFFKSKTDGKTVLVPKFSVRLDDNKTLLYANRGKTYRFGFLTIKDN